MPSGVYLRTKQHAINISKGNIGRVITEETRIKIRATMLGRKYSKERRLAAGLGRRGITAWNKGKGNKTKLTQMIRSSAQYFDWRRKVFARDNYHCLICNKKGGWNKDIKKRITLNVDHLRAFSKVMAECSITSLEKAFDCLELWDMANGRTLCFDCHKKTPNFGIKAKLSPPII